MRGEPGEVEDPERGREDEEEDGDAASVQVYPGQGGLWAAVEDGPGGHQQEEQLQGEADQQAVALELEIDCF